MNDENIFLPGDIVCCGTQMTAEVIAVKDNDCTVRWQDGEVETLSYQVLHMVNCRN